MTENNNQWEFEGTEITAEQFDANPVYHTTQVSNKNINSLKVADVNTTNDHRDMELVLSKCEFLQYCANNPNEVDLEMWNSMASILRYGKNGRDIFHQISQPYCKGKNKYSAKAAGNILDYWTQKGLSPTGCDKISRYGFCPDEGCGVKNPIQLAGLNYTVEEISEKLATIFESSETEDELDEKLIMLAKLRNFDANRAIEEEKRILTLADKQRNKANVMKRIKIAKNKVDNELRAAKTPWFDETGKFKAPLLARHILKTNNFLIVKNSFYQYGGGVYTELDCDRPIRQTISRILGDETKSHMESETIEQLLNQKWQSKLQLTDIDIINCSNGLLNWRTGELKDHTPDFKSINQINADYDPEATCPIFDKMLSEIFYDDQIETVWQMIGYCLIRTAKAQKYFTLLGEGANGKSKFLEIISSFIGRRNVSNESLQNLADNRFRLINIKNKLLNVCDDANRDLIKDTGMIKSITSGATIVGEKKNHHPEEFNFDGTIIIACNELPSTRDNSYGFYRRSEIIVMKGKIPVSQQDKDLFEKTYDEYPGILNKAVAALNRLVNNKYVFPNVERINAAIEAYERANNSAKLFVHQYIIKLKDKQELLRQSEIGQGEWYKKLSTMENGTKKRKMYELYKQWCDDNKKRPFDGPNFNSILEKLDGFKLVNYHGVILWAKMWCTYQIDD